MIKLLIKIPTRSRAAEFYKLYQLYKELATNPNTFFSITIDDDDYFANQAIYDKIPEIVRGVSNSKVHAVNRDMPSNDWDILLLSSDDMFPQVKGYDQIIIDEFEKHFPDTDGCIWFNDGHCKEILNTLPILGRKYFERFGYVYHPSYTSLWADNEFTDVAKNLSKIKYNSQVIIRHEHPDWGGKVPVDALYQKNSTYWTQDETNYKKRKARGFPI